MSQSQGRECSIDRVGGCVVATWHDTSSEVDHLGNHYRAGAHAHVISDIESIDIRKQMSVQNYFSYVDAVRFRPVFGQAYDGSEPHRVPLRVPVNDDSTLTGSIGRVGGARSHSP